jgi:hypothetical protein
MVPGCRTACFQALEMISTEPTARPFCMSTSFRCATMIFAVSLWRINVVFTPRPRAQGRSHSSKKMWIMCGAKGSGRKLNGRYRCVNSKWSTCWAALRPAAWRNKVPSRFPLTWYWPALRSMILIPTVNGFHDRARYSRCQRSSKDSCWRVEFCPDRVKYQR